MLSIIQHYHSSDYCHFKLSVPFDKLKSWRTERFIYKESQWKLESKISKAFIARANFYIWDFLVLFLDLAITLLEVLSNFQCRKNKKLSQCFHVAWVMLPSPTHRYPPNFGKVKAAHICQVTEWPTVLVLALKILQPRKAGMVSHHSC